MLTNAAVLEQIGKPLKIRELIIPDLKLGQVLVDVAYSGVCRSQLNEIRGLRGSDIFLPHALGHEGSGIVLEVGEGVTKVAPDDHVVLSWIKGDGIDAPPTVYRSGAGTVNSGAISTFMDKTIVSENRVTPIPDEMPLREAALLGCAIPTGMGIVFNTAKVRPFDSSVAVFGVGGIGLSVILGARQVLASTIIAVDIFDHKLELARQLGATHLINAGQQSPLAAILDITDGVGVDYAIEASGQREVMETAFCATRYSGGLCVLAGNLFHGDRISLKPFDLIRGKRIVGTWGGETKPDLDIPMYVDLYLSRKLPLGKLITHTYNLEEVNQAFVDLDADNVGRGVIKLC